MHHFPTANKSYQLALVFRKFPIINSYDSCCSVYLAVYYFLALTIPLVPLVSADYEPHSQGYIAVFSLGHLFHKVNSISYLFNLFALAPAVCACSSMGKVREIYLPRAYPWSLLCTVNGCVCIVDFRSRRTKLRTYTTLFDSLRASCISRDHVRREDRHPVPKSTRNKFIILPCAYVPLIGCSIWPCWLSAKKANHPMLFCILPRPPPPPPVPAEIFGCDGTKKYPTGWKLTLLSGSLEKFLFVAAVVHIGRFCFGCYVHTYSIFHGSVVGLHGQG